MFTARACVGGRLFARACGTRAESVKSFGRRAGTTTRAMGGNDVTVTFSHN